MSDCHMERRERQMVKYYIIIAHDGTEVIDDTPEAANRINAMDCLENRHKREYKYNGRQQKLLKNPFYRLACLCGLV